MRKISWLSMGCIAACVVQALVAADGTRTSTPRNSETGRSRLMIYSRSKDKVRTPTPKPETEVGQASLSTFDAEEDAPAQRAARTGDTGTISPLKKVARPAATAQKAPVSARQAAAKAPVVTEDDEEQIRKMFDEEQSRPARPVARPITKSRTERVARQVEETTPASDPFFDDSEALHLKSSSTSRYKDLLESVRPGTTRVAEPKTPAKQDKIVPVSRTTDDNLELEVNPFEPSEQPGTVINAGFKSEAGKARPAPVVPVSATAPIKPAPTSKILHIPNAKPGVAKKADAKKPLVKPTVSIAKGTSVAITETATTHSNQSPQVDVKWEARGEVTLGQECLCALVVHNSGKVPCQELVVEATLPDSVRLVDSSPFPQSSSSKLEWQFSNLAGGEKKTIELTIIPTKPGELAASAQVRFTGTAATSFRVSEPMLATTIKLPTEVRIGDPASATITVSNPGTGTAQNVIVKAALPEGLECSSGQDFVSEIGPIGPGESRVVRLALMATAGGDHTLKVLARSSTSDLEGSAQTGLRVLAPRLTLAASGPTLRYLNRAAKYTLTAANNSNAACDNVRIVQTVAPGFEFVKADNSGRWDAQRRTISWFIGHMEPGQTTAVELDLMPKETGEFKQEFHITGDSGVSAKSVVTTRIEGAASLVMEVKDGEDPIEVGNNLTYSICVHNEGSKSAGKVAVSCELPPDVELVNVDGPTAHLIESGMLIFKPVAEVAAGDSITYKVTLKGMAAGTTKLRARLTSESIQKPLIVEEATQFYAE